MADGSYFWIITSVALTTAVTRSPTFSRISSALRRVITDSITLSPPRLPMTVRQITLVARLIDIGPVDEIDVVVGIVSPSGARPTKIGSPHVHIQLARDYVLATFRDLLLVEPGVHRLQVRLRGQPIVAVEIPVIAAEMQTVAHVQ